MVQDEDLGWTVFSVFRSGLVPRSRQGQALNPTKLTCSSLAIMDLFRLQYLVSLCINHAVSLSPGPLGLEREFMTVCYSPGLPTLVPFFSRKPLGLCLPCLTHFQTSERISERARNSEPTSLCDPHMTTPPLGTCPPPL